jgi:hypothetical protein
MEELFVSTMGPKEKVKYFNHRFTTILNKFQPEVRPTQELQIEVYANTYQPLSLCSLKELLNLLWLRILKRPKSLSSK